MTKKKKQHRERQPASLFIGRWQPLHKGHISLIETVLKKKKPVVIGIRDTEITLSNPYSLTERWDMILRAFKKYGELVKIIAVPDIDEICYGRDVGYAIREIQLGKRLQAISGTKTRKKNRPNHPTIWLTGQTGSGKTTLARTLRGKIGGIVLDGDEMRESISLNSGFSRRDREEHNLRVARLAATLSRQSPVIVAVIAPFRATRKEIDAVLSPLWVYVHRKGTLLDKEHPYETPHNPGIAYDSGNESPESAAQRIVKRVRSGK